jgi:hypothetical protein
LSGCANRGLAQGEKPLFAGARRTEQIGKLGATFRGTEFLIAPTGGDFNVPIKKPMWRGVANKFIRGDGLTERQHTRQRVVEPNHFSPSNARRKTMIPYRDHRNKFA